MTTKSSRRKRSRLPDPMRILVLMHEDLVPPESLDALSDTRRMAIQTEFDVTTTLKKMRHEVLPLGVASDLGVLRDTLNEFKPKITFNLLEEFHGVAVYDQHVVSYLELMKRSYTGCNPRGLMLAHDKALSKKIMAYHRIPVPHFAVFPLGRKVRRPKQLKFPLLVKSLTEEASEGISQASVVHDDAHLVERAEFIHRQFATDAIAESYIEGRELYDGVLGNRRLQTMPIWELQFSKMPDDLEKIATSKVKWDLNYQKKHGILWGAADNLAPEIAEKVVRICKRAYRSLHLTGYARIDLRLTEDGRVYVLEANPNPDLSQEGELSESAGAMGMNYRELLGNILRLGMNYRAEWQE
jgi:D-alanine-D-alanine ligase